MVYKAFFDTNIILDFLLEERENHFHAKQIFFRVQNATLYGYINETVLTNIAYVLRKVQPVESLKVQMMVLLHYFEVLASSTSVCQAALQSTFTDIEDAILYHLALQHRLDNFVTENIKDFKKGALPGLPVVTAAHLLRIL